MTIAAAMPSLAEWVFLVIWAGLFCFVGDTWRNRATCFAFLLACGFGEIVSNHYWLLP